MTYAFLKERESRFKLALRTVIPTLLFIITLFALFLDKETFVLFVFITVVGSIFISYYNLYVIYNGFNTDMIDHETMTLNFKSFCFISEKLSKKTKNFTFLMVKMGDLEVINAHYGRDQVNNMLKNIIALFNEKLIELGFKNTPIGHYGGGYFVFALEYPKEKIEELILPFLKSKEQCYMDDIEIDIEYAYCDAKKSTLQFSEIFSYLFDLIAIKAEANEDETSQLHFYSFKKRVIEAIHSGSLSLQFQKVLNCKSNEIEILEFSAKLIDHTDKYIHNNDLIPMINKLGMEKQFYFLVIEKMFEIIKENRIEKKCALIISGFALRHAQVRNYFFESLKDSHLKPGQLILIIQENYFYKHVKRYNEIIQLYREQGIAIAFSHFGGDAPVLEYLKNIQVDYVKYDKSLTDSLTNNYTRILFDSLDKILEARSIKKWAVMVENEEIKYFLEARGMDYLQGWGIGKFEPIENLKETV